MRSEEVKMLGPIIIESLKDSEKKTGRILHDETLKYKAFQEPNLTALYYEAPTKADFFKTLDLIVEKVRNEKFFPFLHIESHGYAEGIHLAAGEDVSWKELMPYLIEINTLIWNMLVLSLGTCYGIALISAIDPEKRAPFRFVLGASKEIGQQDVLHGFEKYFESFFFSFDAVKSLELLEGEIGKGKVFMISEEECFDKIVDTERDPKAFKDMVYKKAIERKLQSLKYQRMDFQEVFKQTDAEVRTAFKNLKGRKGYFCMRDLRPKKK